MNKLLITVLVAALLLLAVPASFAQGIGTATISGTVSDPSGAVVPKATVTVTNEATGVKRTVQTNDAGFFSVPTLDVGTYTVSVTAGGFKTVEKKGIALHVADNRNVPMILELGTATETVTVTGGAVEVELRSGEVSNLIGSQQMTELPLNGRSFVQLVTLVPGASVADGARMGNTGLFSSMDMSVSGSASNANSWLVDGADNLDHGSGRTILVYPSVDSIEEFKVQRNSFTADNPAGGIQVNLVTKGGTNKIHGTVYEFFRNDKLNANSFFLNEAGVGRPEVRSNNFGYTLGGPVKKDKVFFYWSEEWRKQIRGIVRHWAVPTPAQKKGDFSGFDPFGLPVPINPYDVAQDGKGGYFNPAFPGNKIPSNLLSQAGLDMMQIWPDPNLSKLTQSGQNWVTGVPTSNPTREEQVRGDINISDKTSLMLRFTNDMWFNPAPNGGSEMGLWGDSGYPTIDSTWNQPSKSAAARLTHTFGPTAVNTFQFSYSGNRIIITPGTGLDLLNKINTDHKYVYNHPNPHPEPVFWGGSPVPNGNNLWNIAPFNNDMNLWTFKNDFSKTAGNHNIRVGVYYSRNSKNEDMQSATYASSYWGSVGGGYNPLGIDNQNWGDPKAIGAVSQGWGGTKITGNSMADFLLKGAYWASGDEFQTQPRVHPRWHDTELYYADTWRIKPRVTLDYGLRWSALPPMINAGWQSGNFIPWLWDPTAKNLPTAAMIYPESLVMPEWGIKGGKANLKGIDVGDSLVKSPFGSFAPRFGLAIDPVGDGKWAIRLGAGIYYNRADVMGISNMGANAPFNAKVSWGSGRPFDYLASPPPSQGLSYPGAIADVNWKVGGSYQWNLTIEHEIMKDTKLEVAYVGNRGIHLPMNFNLNSVPVKDRAKYLQILYTPGQGEGSARYLQTYSALAAQNQMWYSTNGANSYYHAFQAFLNKRFSNNFSYQLSYTFSKLISQTGLGCCTFDAGTRVNDIYNAGYDRGIGSFDRTHIMSFNMIYKFPQLANAAKAARFIAGGWEGTMIYQYSSGQPMSVGSPNGLSQVLFTNGTTGTRADLVGDATANLAPGQFINPAAFAIPLNALAYGNSPKGVVRAPAINNGDIAVYKNFRIKEGKQLQFRLETFNTFNHTQFYNIDRNYTTNNVKFDQNSLNFIGCTALAGNSGRNCNVNKHFGYPNSAKDPREIQLALKFIF